MLVHIHIHKTLLEHIRVVQNTLWWQIFHKVNVIESILRSFRTDLLAIQNTKALQHGCRLLRLPTSEMVKGNASAVRHIPSRDLRIHHWEFRIFGIKVIVKTQRGCEINCVLKGQVGLIPSFQHLDHLALLLLVNHIKAGVLVLAQVLDQTLAEHVCLIQIDILIFTLADLRETVCRGVQSHKLPELIC